MRSEQLIFVIAASRVDTGFWPLKLPAILFWLAVNHRFGSPAVL